LIGTLSNTSFYHSSSFDKSEYKTILKIIQWPQEIRFPGLDVLRLLVLHPHAALHYADAYKNGKEDSVLDIAFSFLLDESLSETNHMMLWRFLANLFKEEKCRVDTIVEAFDPAIDLAPGYSKHQNLNIRLGVATTLLNFSVELTKNKETEKKCKIIPILLEMLKPAESVEILYRIVIALGTSAYKDDKIKELIKQSRDKLQFEVLQENATEDFSKLKEPLNELINMLSS